MLEQSASNGSIDPIGYDLSNQNLHREPRDARSANHQSGVDGVISIHSFALCIHRPTRPIPPFTKLVEVARRR
jgi:hypothetical protein